MSAMKILAVILGVFTIIAGAYCLLFPGLEYWIIAYVIGVCMILDSAGRIAAWWNTKKNGEPQGIILLSGLISLVFGVILVASPSLQFAFDLFIIYMMAAWVLLLGIIRIVFALRIRKLHKTYETNYIGKNWGIALALGILLVLLGLYSIFYPMVMAITIGILVGIGLLVTGANLVYIGLSSDSN